MAFLRLDKTVKTSEPSNPAGVLNFRSIHTRIAGKVGYKGSTDTNIALPYVGEKPGGSDVGHMVDAGNSVRLIIKTGVTLGLLAKILQKLTDKKLAEDDRLKKERLFLSFIVGNFTRIAGGNPKLHPELLALLSQKYGEVTEKNFGDLLTKEMLETFNQFKASEIGQLMWAKVQAEGLTSKDVYTIFRFMVAQNPNLKDVIGLSAFSDIVNGAYGQHFNNVYQARVVPKEMLDDHRLLIEASENPEMFMASRFNAQAQSFDTFLLEPFFKNDRSQFESKELWLEKCKADLANKITNLNGLGSALLIRHLMGENADLGPDNMLIVTIDDAQYIINIDVTGFRYARSDTYRDERKNETRLGWKDTLKANTDPTELLFDKTVFSDRFIQDSKLPKDVKSDVMNVIVEVLKNKCGAKIAHEVQDVREWLQSENAELATKSLHAAMDEAYDAFDDALKPQRRYLDCFKERNQGFVSDCINEAKNNRNEAVNSASHGASQ